MYSVRRYRDGEKGGLRRSGKGGAGRLDRLEVIGGGRRGGESDRQRDTKWVQNPLGRSPECEHCDEVFGEGIPFLHCLRDREDITELEVDEPRALRLEGTKGDFLGPWQVYPGPRRLKKKGKRAFHDRD